LEIILSPEWEETIEHLEQKKLSWFRCQLSDWAIHHLRDFPWRRTSDPYAIFVAEFLLQKTDTAKVVPVYEAFLSQYPTINALALAPVAEVARLLQPLSLYFRAERLCQSAQLVVESLGGKIPDTQAQLLTLPGVGKYTARSVCANAFSQPLAYSIPTSLGSWSASLGCKGKSEVALQNPVKAAEQAAPQTEIGKWNLTLLDFGATACTARNPCCTKCPLQKQCNYFNC
jgi:A/G-specific adenine glycosylase